MIAPTLPNNAGLAGPREIHQQLALVQLMDAWQNAVQAGLRPAQLVAELGGGDAPVPEGIVLDSFPGHGIAFGDGVANVPCAHLTWRLSAKPVPPQTSLVVAAQGSIPVKPALAAPVTSRVLPAPTMAGVIPRWDAGSRTLFHGARVVKQFRQRAKNQVLILAAFEEMDWPQRIDDPLPRGSGLEPKQRLREAVRSLNLSQKNPLVSFVADGTGTGIVWRARS